MSATINNEIYSQLGERWYHANDDPVALLRHEAKIKNHWIQTRIAGRSRVLDIGCGAGFLTNFLAEKGHEIVGLDASDSVLEVARRYDRTQSVKYVTGSALDLPFEPESFDVVCAMDFLEHVEDPSRVVLEAARVLGPGGRFFFHTFNRNWLSWLVVIKGMEWFVKGTPPHLHVLKYFIKPAELKTYCERSGLRWSEVCGLAPVLWNRATLNLMFTGIVPEDFCFRISPRLWAGYLGFSQKVNG